jgi:hypothetical protein
MAIRCKCLDLIVIRPGIALNDIHIQQAWELLEGHGIVDACRI